MKGTISAKSVTTGPKRHWFGYYDKLQFDVSGRYLLGMEVDFEHRTPTADDVIHLGMIDLHDSNRWIELGQSRAWCWQQGCMLQWIPGSDSKVIWNDREGDCFVSHIMDVQTKEMRTLPNPVYTLSSDGKPAIYPDFRRINDMRPGYGYAGLPDPCAEEPTPKDSGIWRMDLATGQTTQILSIADIVQIPNPNSNMSKSKHYFNHLLFNTDGSRFVFLHRYPDPAGNWRFTRAITASIEGDNIHVVNDHGMWSHFIWRDPKHLLAWSKHPSKGGAFYLYEDRSDHVETVGEGVLTNDAHASYLPGGEWIVGDSYPTKESRDQPLYLYHVPTSRKVRLGEFRSPEPYTGEWRCDLHPRVSRDGQTLCIDSAHGGNGRQMYLIDVGEVIQKEG